MHAQTRREALAGIGGFAAALMTGCAYNPVTGRRELMLMTESQEVALGQQGNADIIASYGVYDNAAIAGVLTDRGNRMARISHRPGLSYQFTLLDSPVVNAFALPGGYIYVTRGIMGYFNNEAQLVGVLGHELGHVTARHSAQQYSKAQLANLTLSIGSTFSEEFAKYAQYASVGLQLMFLKFSRDDEREADRLGIQYSSEIGYDAIQMSSFFETLKRLSPEGGSLPAWQSTHPDPEERTGTTLDLAREYQADHPGDYLIRRNEYLELVDGLPFGEDPRQGYVDGGVFYHPALRFRFTVPNGWTLTNAPSEVRLSPENGQAAMIFTIAEGSDQRAAAQSFVNGTGMTVTSEATADVNGMSAYRLAGTLTSNGQELAVSAYFVNKDGQVFAFLGISAPGDAAMYAPAFASVVTGFRTLTEQSRLQVEPDLIEVRSVTSNVLLSKALNDFGVPEARAEEMAVMNGLELYNLVEAGTRIKIVD